MFPRIMGKKITASVILCAFVISKNAFAIIHIIYYHACDSLLLHNILIGMIYHK